VIWRRASRSLREPAGVRGLALAAAAALAACGVKAPPRPPEKAAAPRQERAPGAGEAGAPDGGARRP
jgi:predicted small lipoprotein YifL